MGASAVTIATHMLTFLSVLGLRPRLRTATASQFHGVAEVGGETASLCEPGQRFGWPRVVLVLRRSWYSFSIGMVIVSRAISRTCGNERFLAASRTRIPIVPTVTVPRMGARRPVLAIRFIRSSESPPVVYVSVARWERDLGFGCFR